MEVKSEGKKVAVGAKYSSYHQTREGLKCVKRGGNNTASEPSKVMAPFRGVRKMAINGPSG